MGSGRGRDPTTRVSRSGSLPRQARGMRRKTRWIHLPNLLKTRIALDTSPAPPAAGLKRTAPWPQSSVPRTPNGARQRSVSRPSRRSASGKTGPLPPKDEVIATGRRVRLPVWEPVRRRLSDPASAGRSDRCQDARPGGLRRPRVSQGGSERCRGEVSLTSAGLRLSGSAGPPIYCDHE